MEQIRFVSDAWVTYVEGCYWLHVKAGDETIASLNLSAEERPIKETLKSGQRSS
jgi:hypothetical protein